MSPTRKVDLITTLKQIAFLIRTIICIQSWKTEGKDNILPKRCKNIYQIYLTGIPSQHSLIWSYYKLFKSTYWRLKNSDDSVQQIIPINQANSQKKWLSEEAKLLVTKLVEPPKLPLVIEDLKRKIFEILKEDYNDAMIRNFLKSDLKYSFK